MTDHIPAEAMTADTDPALDEHRETVAFMRENAAALGLRPEPSEDEREALGAIRTAQAKAMTEGDHVLADQLDAASRYVIATRRPMPSRGQVAEWYLANSQYDGPLVPRKLSMAAYDFADTVLALFEKGAEG